MGLIPGRWSGQLRVQGMFDDTGVFCNSLRKEKGWMLTQYFEQIIQCLRIKRHVNFVIFLLRTEKHYGSPFLDREKEVIAIGVNFSSAEKAVEEWRAVSYRELELLR